MIAKDCPGKYDLYLLNAQLHCTENTRRDEITEHWPLIKWASYIRIASQIGYVISLITLIIAIIVFFSLRKLKNPRIKLHMHLFVSFMMKTFITILKDWIFINELGIDLDLQLIFIGDVDDVVMQERNIWISKVLSSLWRYFNVASYLWISMEGLYLYKLIFKPLCVDGSKITQYIILGWGLPVLLVVTWIIILKTIEADISCWSITCQNFYLVFFAMNIPIIVSILYNFLLFLAIILFGKASMHLQWEKTNYKAWAKATMVVILLFGIHYICFWVSFFSHAYNVVLILLFFCEQLFKSYQGALVSLLYCLLNSEVIEEMRQAWRTRRSKKKVDLLSSFVFDLREILKNLKDGINRKQYRSEGNDGTSHRNEKVVNEIC